MHFPSGTVSVMLSWRATLGVVPQAWTGDVAFRTGAL